MAERIEARIDRPLIIFDGQCSFCRRWVARAKSITGSRVDYEPYQQAAPRFPQIDPAGFTRAVHLIEPEGSVRRGARAVFGALALGGRYSWLLGCYEYVPGFAGITEAAYRVVATHRETADRVDMLLVGPGLEQPSYLLTRQIFLRMLGLIYLFAFVSLGSQIDGLVGSRGILPVRLFLNEVQSAFGRDGYWQFPTLCWFNASDGFLHLLCDGGEGAAILLIAGFAQLPTLIVLLAFYLSLAVAGQDFLQFQWDYLLLETGFLAIFLAPGRLWSWKLEREAEPSRVVILLLRWLLFRLIFMSGVVKLSSKDPTWHSWTALRFHYMTQPLPTWTSWYFYQLPGWFHTASCGVVFFCELVVPFLFFGPRRVRLAAFWVSVGFQLLIAGTGNYGFFNLLAIVLCCVLPDDAFWRWLLRRGAAPRLIGAPPGWRGWITVPVALALLTLTIPICIEAFGISVPLPSAIGALANYVEPLRIASGYGLFANMTTQRPEIIIEGSNDGQTWRAYAFKWKPGDIGRRPEFTTPHMPRLDWQIWFPFQPDQSYSFWFISFIRRLQEGSKPVLGLLETNPFPDHPPRLIRAVLYDYQMTDFAERRTTGNWWKRREMGVYYGPEIPAD